MTDAFSTATTAIVLGGLLLVGVPLFLFVYRKLDEFFKKTEK